VSLRHQESDSHRAIPATGAKSEISVFIPPKLWLVRNEVGGWTAMYPEDY